MTEGIDHELFEMVCHERDALHAEKTRLLLALRELQAAAIQALNELDAPKVQISGSYERLIAAIDRIDSAQRLRSEDAPNG